LIFLELFIRFFVSLRVIQQNAIVSDILRFGHER